MGGGAGYLSVVKIDEYHVDITVLLLHVDRGEGGTGGRGEVDSVAHVVQVIVINSKASVGGQRVVKREGSGAERCDAALVCGTMDEHGRDGSSGSHGSGESLHQGHQHAHLVQVATGQSNLLGYE